ncbi:hypothetical protein TRFO_38053 [Tritrichomonas foetus]|uniref:TPR Domain containing protein n=1 Tax=Tritrichomonas foetus TaxID=1144522 RepID=A0A1J4J9F0_9EUKA|nr:hypothetical protein TRFO_38053 [Tritrichomonas foetus]|eukprot:OHS95806.1 hypothetical protein TRFO_38053 [Tritrichomonas foetus]
MNVRGFNSDGGVTELQVAAQNESLVALSTRFTQAMNNFPSFETENALIAIMDDIQDTEYAKIVRFQCEREIAKCKILREQYAEAIPFLIQSLKTDENRADIWSQLAICAQNTKNANLFRAANSRIRKLRPQMEIKSETLSLPSLIIPNESPKFVGYQLNNPCWRAYLTLLGTAAKTNPYDIPEIVFSQGQIAAEQKYDLGRPLHIRHQPITMISKQNIVKTLGGQTLTNFFQTMVVQQTSQTNFLFSEPSIALCATTINRIVQFPFISECIQKDIALSLIDLALKYVFDELTPRTKLFLAELAAVYRPDQCGVFLRDIDSANLHSQNALLRLAFATLQESIRQNLDYSIIESQLTACRLNLENELCLAHAGIVINKELLDKKEHQISILKMISTQSTTDANVALFEKPELLQFLQLSNIIKMFLQFDNAAMTTAFPMLLALLPELILKNRNEIENLSKIFNKVNDPMDKEPIANLINTFKALNDVGADPNLVFSCALAIARASVNYEDRANVLVKVHKQLGKLQVCCSHSGKFLEYLIDALLPRVDEFENDLTSAFTCYFSDVPLCNVNHHSTLKFRCSRFVQPFAEHVNRLDVKGCIQQFFLFAPYLSIWKHWKGKCNCIDSIDGWRMYRIIKKKESQLSKSELPEGYTPQSVLEDLLRHDPENRTESRVALGKVLIRSFCQASEPNKDTLNEAIELLSCGDGSPPLMLINAIAHALLGEDPHKTAEMLLGLQDFPKPKKEARRLYWLIRSMIEIGHPEQAKPAADKAMKLRSSLTTDYALPLQCLAAEVYQNKKIYQDAINTYCKSRIPSPYPYIGLAKQSNPHEAFNLILKLVRPQSVNITNFYHFEFKPPFLLAKPDDSYNVRHEILKLYVENATASGNYLKLFGLFNPSMKVDRKASKVLSKNRIIYGIDRLWVFEKYIRELTKACIAKGEKMDSNLIDRAIDSLARGTQVELTDGLKEALEELFNFMWKLNKGSDPPPDASVSELINIITGQEEEDEEEDTDFKESDSEEDGNEAREAEAAESGDEEDEDEADAKEEEEEAEDDEDDDDDDDDEADDGDEDDEDDDGDEADETE